MTTPLSLSEVGVIYKLIGGKRNSSLILCSFNCLFTYPAFTGRSLYARYYANFQRHKDRSPELLVELQAVMQTQRSYGFTEEMLSY